MMAKDGKRQGRQAPGVRRKAVRRAIPKETGRKAEQALHVSDNWYRAIYDASPLAMVVWDRQRRVVDWNRQAEQMFGWTREEILGKDFFDFLLPESARPGVSGIVDALLAGRLPSRSTNENLTKRGQTILCAWYNSIQRDSQGKVIGVISLAMDITEHRRAEEALRESSALLRLVSSGIPYAMLYQIVRKPDGSRRFTYVSEGVRHLYGCSPEEAMADPVRIYGRVHEEDRDRVLAGEEKAYRDFTAFRTEVRIRNPDGGLRWSYFASSPRRLPNGVTAWDGIEIDITSRKQAENALERERNLYKDLVASQPSGVYRLRIKAQKPWSESEWVGKVESHYKLELVSDLFCKILGATREQCEANTGIVVESIHPEDRPGFVSRNVRALETLEPFAWEGRLKVQDKVTWVYFASVPRLLDDGDVIWTGILLDITERKRAEAALQESEENQRTLIAALPDVIMRFDADCRHLFVSENVEDVTGIPAAAFLGKTHHELGFPEPMCEMWDQAIRQPFLTGKDYEIEFDLDGPAGRITFNWHLTPDMDDAGRVRTVLAVARDITSRKKAEALLRIKDTAVASAIAGIAITDMDGKINYVNPAWLHMHGHDSADDVIGTTPLQNVQDPAEADAVIRAIKQMGAWTGELVCRRRDGSCFTAELACSLMTDVAGRPTGMVASFQDMTERKKLEAERRELDVRLHQTQRLESLGVLAGGIAHDFNNILMAVMGHAELALDELSPLAPGRESVEQIKTAAIRAAELCTQMLAYSGRGRLEKRDFGLGQLVDEMMHMVKTCVSKKCVLNLNLEKQLPRMHGDASQIRQVLMNLVINASEAIGDRSGSITVSTGAMDCPEEYLAQSYITQPLAAGLYVYLEVSDTGCGMSRETTQRMFEPFFTTKFTGRGLGLAAVLGIVQAHNGAIRVYSELGKGTTIKVLFPAAAGAVLDGTESPAVSRWRGRGKVLLVDDEETVRAISRRLLERLGLKVLTADDGQAAVALYRERKGDIDVVLLDLTMPRMNGEEAFRELRQINPRVHVILASGYSEGDIAGRFAGKGLAGYLQKPYTLEKLRFLLSSLLPEASPL